MSTGLCLPAFVYKMTEIQAGRQTDRWTNGKMNIWADRFTDDKMDTWTDKQTDICAIVKMNIWTDNT